MSPHITAHIDIFNNAYTPEISTVTMVWSSIMKVRMLKWVARCTGLVFVKLLYASSLFR